MLQKVCCAEGAECDVGRYAQTEFPHEALTATCRYRSLQRRCTRLLSFRLRCHAHLCRPFWWPPMKNVEGRLEGCLPSARLFPECAQGGGHIYAQHFRTPDDSDTEVGSVLAPRPRGTRLATAAPAQQPPGSLVQRGPCGRCKGASRSNAPSRRSLSNCHICHTKVDQEYSRRVPRCQVMAAVTVARRP